uniref:Uncharacterized protein n=1 Tax=Anguilla anguilla TaxID=7936 RepID=A0A0E9VXL3_ANGAN
MLDSTQGVSICLRLTCLRYHPICVSLISS